MSRSLAEQYRPQTLAEFLGNPKAVAAARWHLARGLGGQAFWISGASGSGKTTLARILARSVAAELAIEEFDSADQVNQAAFDHLSRGLYCLGPPPGGRVVIINEAHGLAARVARQLLGLLERLPRHATVLFTTTRIGERALFEDIDGRPLVDRCVQIPLTIQGLGEPFARRLVDVAAREGFSVPLSKAKELLSDNGCSLRAGLEWLGSPQSMPYLAAPAEAAA